MKLFIWEDPYDVKYGGSICVVMAETLEQAKDIAASGQAWLQWDYKDTPIQRNAPLGEPTKVLDGPSAAWAHWEE